MTDFFKLFLLGHGQCHYHPNCSRNLEVCKIKEVYAPSFTMFQTMSFDLVTGIKHTFLRPCRSTFYQQSLPSCSHNRTVTESWLLELLQGSYHKQKYHWCEKDVIINYYPHAMIASRDKKMLRSWQDLNSLNHDIPCPDTAQALYPFSARRVRGLNPIFLFVLSVLVILIAILIK